MQFVFPVREKAITLLPSITHVDGSARLQTVSETSNEKFYNLLRHFEDATGIPVFLNKSF